MFWANKFPGEGATQIVTNEHTYGINAPNSDNTIVQITVTSNSHSSPVTLGTASSGKLLPQIGADTNICITTSLENTTTCTLQQVFSFFLYLHNPLTHNHSLVAGWFI